MPKKQQQEQLVAPQEAQPLEQRNAAIAETVIDTVGQPNDLQTVQVRWLWKNRYRVNIFTGQDITSAKVANSYFLVADSDGNIIASTPELARQY